jgi:hypothetical protein
MKSFSMIKLKMLKESLKEMTSLNTINKFVKLDFHLHLIIPKKDFYEERNKIIKIMLKFNLLI